MSDGARVSRWIHALVLLVLLGSGAAAVGYRLTAPALWVDEAYARHDGLGPLRGLLRSPDPHVISSHLYHLINRASEALTGDMALGNRLPQAVAAWVSLVFVYLLARECFSPGAGLLAVLLLITHPFFVRYAQENRLQQMVSCGMLASLYCSVQYLYRRRLGWLAGYVVSTAVLVRCGYGILPVVIISALWLAIYLQQRSSAQPVEGRAVVECFAAIVVVLALWLPYPVWFVRNVCARGVLPSLTRGLPALDVFWEAPMPLTPQAVLSYCHQHFAGALPWPLALLLLVAALAGSVRYRRGTAWSIAAYGVLVTIVSFHIMNLARGGTVPRRYVYLCPFTMLMLAGGMAMSVALLTELCRAVLQHVPWRRGNCTAAARMVPAVLWVAVVMAVAWPVVSDHAYQLSQYYFTDRHVYKTMAHVLNTCAAPGTEVISIDTDTRDWVLNLYATSGTWQLARLYTTCSYYGKPASLTPDVISQLLAPTSIVWLTQCNLAEYDATGTYVAVPCGESWRYGLLTCVNPAYARDPQLRQRDAEAMARAVVYGSVYPKVTCARFLAELLLARGDTNAADHVMHYLARYRWSFAATHAAAEYFAARGDAAVAQACRAAFARRTWWRRLPLIGTALIALTWPDQFAWFDYTDFGLAADVAGIARPDEWLGPRSALQADVTP